jgi:hypothetical protein
MRAFLKCRLPEHQPHQGPHCPHPRALPYTKMVSFTIKHYDLLKSSMDFFWIELSLTMSQSCLEFNWWAVGEGLLGMGSKYRLFPLRRMHQNVKKLPLQLRVLVSPSDFGHYNFLFPRFSLRVFRYGFDIFLGVPAEQIFLVFVICFLAIH